MLEHKFISEGSPHLTSQFCRIELTPTQILVVKPNLRNITNDKSHLVTIIQMK